MTTTQQRSHESVHSQPKPSGGHAFRPDVEGLRAVAVGLVLLYHARVDRFAGGFIGVDVFFVISGFLITGLLIRELQATGRVSLITFYARRAKRLLPATAVVLVATALMTAAFVPIVDRQDFGRDMLAAAMYFINWRLANRSVNYLAEDSGLSPVQHFWSLAVEEQFYIVWPLLILGVAWWMRRVGWSLRTALGTGLAAIALPSFAWSVYQTSHNPSRAFFVSTTRMWELALGAGVAIAVPELMRIPRGLAVAGGWLGVAAIVAAGAVFSASSAWPGYLALLPTLGTAAVIAAGPSACPAGPVVLLGTRAFTWVGGLSYSLYLWPWPMVVAAAAYWDGLSARRGLVVVALTVIPAWLTRRLVENPARYSAALTAFPRRALAVGAACTLVGVTAGAALLLAVPDALPTTATDGRRALGAAALGATRGDRAAAAKPVDKVAFITPDPLKATKDVPEAYARGCQVDHTSSEPVSCVFGAEQGATTVALVGDSKAL